MSIAYMNNPTESVINFDDLNINFSHPIIEIQVSCRNLIKLDIGSASDPLCVLFTKEKNNWVESQRTEAISNEPNPNFVKKFKTFYIFELYQPLRFEVYDVDSSNSSLKKQDFIGYAETDVQYLVSNQDQKLTFELKHDKKSSKRGELILTAQQTKESNSHLQGELQVHKLKRMNTFSKNHPFFEISKPLESGQYFPVYRSEIKKRCYSCKFKKFTLPIHSLVRESLDDPITLTFFDHRRRKPPNVIGRFEISVRQLMETVNTQYDLTNSSKNVGVFWFNQLEVVQIPTFADYLRSGLKLNMITAIDFTGSNEDPARPRSLHYIKGNGLNQYQQSIVSVGSILTKYASTQKYAVFGFGCRYNKEVEFCLPLTFDQNNIEVDGLDGILNAYKNTFDKIILSGPTNFQPVILKATEMAVRSFEESKTYTILLILTDGVICDLQETKDAIVEASDKPLSIIIIGVGNANFSDMELLDSDEKVLMSSSGKYMKRDIVQFVPFNKFKNCSKDRLESELLAEVPRQVHEFCSTHGFVPNSSADEII